MDGLMLKYFVLKPKGDTVYAQASRMAMRAYAKHIRFDNPQLSSDLYNWTENEMLATEAAEQAGKALGHYHKDLER